VGRGVSFSRGVRRCMAWRARDRERVVRQRGNGRDRQQREVCSRQAARHRPAPAMQLLHLLPQCRHLLLQLLALLQRRLQLRRHLLHSQLRLLLLAQLAALLLEHRQSARQRLLLAHHLRRNKRAGRCRWCRVAPQRGEHMRKVAAAAAAARARVRTSEPAAALPQRPAQAQAFAAAPAPQRRPTCWYCSCSSCSAAVTCSSLASASSTWWFPDWLGLSGRAPPSCGACRVWGAARAAGRAAQGRPASRAARAGQCAGPKAVQPGAA
jgi:hypothetical protein